jgi:peptide chain release factor 1
LDDIVLEIRAGTGGDEAELFAADLFKMYFKFATKQGFRVEIDDANLTPLGGIKELVAEIHGRGAYGLFKYESGVHRVQRIPETEKQGRIHTSTATVAILPLPEEPQVEIKPEDLRIETFRSSGHGGQSVNTTDSAVRITHLPTGLVVSCQEERSQLKNREKALKVLKARLLNLEYQKTLGERDEQRRLQVKSAKRAEKIRTYNFPQDRLTDHRLDFSFHNLPQFLNGELMPLIEALKKADLEERLALLQKKENENC